MRRGARERSEERTKEEAKQTCVENILFFE